MSHKDDKVGLGSTVGTKETPLPPFRGSMKTAGTQDIRG